ncbi:MAG TPA: alpha/beta hydrolase, partial [Chloroflexota bacterium]|nr:alpha/beta hydrolase [Chloroflexota bacterium]
MITSVQVLLILVGIVAIVVATVLVIAAYSAHTVVRPRRSWRPGEIELPAKAPESVTFKNGAGLRLHGWYVPPRARKAVVMVCHGFGTNRTEGIDVWPWLNEAGYGVLLFDFQAHGESEGRYTTVGLREVEDVHAAIDYLQKREGEDVILLGFGISMGAS